jgi:hypothetical protein
MTYRGFMLWPDGRIEEVDPDGETYDYPAEPSLFDDLVKAGYPLLKHHEVGDWDGIIDLRVEGSRVIVHTQGPPKPYEHDMGAAGELFLAWLRLADQDNGDTGS